MTTNPERLSARDLTSIAHARYVARLITNEGGYRVARSAVRAQLPRGTSHESPGGRMRNSTSHRLRSSLSLLERLGLVHRDADWVYVPDAQALEHFAADGQR